MLRDLVSSLTQKMAATTTTTTPRKPEHILMLDSYSPRGGPGLPVPEKLFEPIKSQFPDFEVTLFKIEEGKGVPKDVWQKATVLITLFILPSSIEDVPNLHLIHLTSAGSDHVTSKPFFDDPATSHITLTTSSGIHGPPIAEWVLMSTLVLTKHYNVTHQWQKERRWGNKGLWHTSSGDWVGKNVGILGYGSIGRQVARVFSAVGANIHAYTNSPRDNPESKKDHGYIIPHTGDPDGIIPTKWFSAQKDTLDTFLRSGLHAVVVCTPLTPSTRHLLNEREFKLLQSTSPWPSSSPSSKSASLSGTSENNSSNSNDNDHDHLNKNKKEEPKQGAMIINISRGSIINQPDLVTALQNKTIKAAALDVTDPEPLPEENALWDLDNVVLAPHVSSVGDEYLPRSLDVLRLNLERFGKGEKMVNVVRRGRGY